MRPHAMYVGGGGRRASTRLRLPRGMTFTQRRCKQLTGLLFYMIMSSEGLAAPALAADLIVVGAGVLGRRVAKLWQDVHEGDAVVYTVTRTLDSERKAELESMGCRPLTQQELRDKSYLHNGAYSNVVFCAPPSGNEDYVGDVQSAVQLWNGAGGLVFTSSSGVYLENDMGIVTESSDVQDTERSQKLIAGEAAVTSAGGAALRFAGLYTTRRGPQSFFLSREEIDSNPDENLEDNMVNMVHYADAANAVVQALLESVTDAAEEAPQVRGNVFNVAAGSPISRQDICVAALKSPVYKGRTAPKFLQEPQVTGKVIDCTKLQMAMPNWQPQYPSFAEAMASIPEDSED